MDDIARNVATTLDIDPAQLSKIYKYSNMGNHETENLLVRAYISLYQIMGGHRPEMKVWMTSQNSHLSGIPKELIMREGRLNDVVCYLERFK